jgi:hypothetical protein
MQLEVRRELQKRGRFFYEMFPGAKASEDWQRQRDLLDEREAEASPSSTVTADDLRKDPERSELKE